MNSEGNQNILRRILIATKVAEAKNVQNFVAPVSPNSAKLVKIGKTPIKLQHGKHSGNKK